MSDIRKKLLQRSLYADEAEAKKRLERRIAELNDYKEAELESILRKRKAVRKAETKVAEDLALYEYLTTHKEEAAKILAAELQKAKDIHTGLHKPKAKVPATPAAPAAYEIPVEHEGLSRAELQHIAKNYGIPANGSKVKLSRLIVEYEAAHPPGAASEAAHGDITRFFSPRSR